MTNPVMSLRDWLLLITLSVLWGGTFFFTEVALVDLPPFTIVLGRVGLAAVALLIWVNATGARMPGSPGIWGAFLVMGLLNNAIPFTLIFSGQVHIESGLASILNGTTPFFSVLLAHVLTAEERITPNRIAGLLPGLAGVAVLVGPEALRGLGAVGIGQVMVLGAAFSYACAAIYGRRFRGLPPTVTAAGQVTCSALIMLPVTLIVDEPWAFNPGLATWGALLAISLLSTAVAYIVYFRILATAGATNLMLVTLLIPVTALVLGAAFLGERLGPPAFVGMLLIFAGLAAIDGRALGWLRRGTEQRAP